jgi:hypothetical protein
MELRLGCYAVVPGRLAKYFRAEHLIYWKSSRMILNPRFRPSAADLRLLQDDVRADVLGKPRILSPTERRKLSDRLATEATWSLFDQIKGAYEIVDANSLRYNQHGYDFIIDNRLRIQVKGSTYVEGLGWAVKSEKSLAFDVLLWVDIGAVVDGNVGRLAGSGIPVKSFVDYYVVPISTIKEWLARAIAVNGRGNNIYLWKKVLNRGTNEAKGQTFELKDWLNRFDVFDAMLRIG